MLALQPTVQGVPCCSCDRLQPPPPSDDPELDVEEDGWMDIPVYYLPILHITYCIFFNSTFYFYLSLDVSKNKYRYLTSFAFLQTTLLYRVPNWESCR